nr:hypothetical protein BaRGS_025203 [Batillaria attramentaria]
MVTIGAVGVLERENTPPPDTTCGLIVSILVLIFCAWPCGIGSIVFNRRANEYKLLGQHTLARASMRTSTIWNVIGVITGIIAWAIIGVYIYRLNQVVDDFYGN